MIFLRNGQEQSFTAGTTIFKAGDPSNNLIYYILNGMVEQRIDTPAKRLYSERLLAHHLFGIVTPFVGATTRIETVRTIAPVKAYVWTLEDFLKITPQSLKIVALVMTDLAKQLRDLNAANISQDPKQNTAVNPLGILLESKS